MREQFTGRHGDVLYVLRELFDLAKHHSEELFKFIMSGRLLTDLRGRSGKFITEYGPEGIHLYLEPD